MQLNTPMKRIVMACLRPWIILMIGCLHLAGCAATTNERTRTGVEQQGAKEADATGAQRVEVYEEKYPDGTVRIRDEGWKDAEGNFIRHGRLTNYWENGQKKSEVTYVNGVRHGPRTTWYPSGQIRNYGEYVDGRENGTWTEWYPTGQKARESRFDHGAWHGLWTEWHPNGQKKMEFEYVRGKKQGPLTVWDEEGKILRQVEYVDDVEQP